MGTPTTPRKPVGGSTDGKTLDPGALLHALQSVAHCDLSVRLPGDRVGLEGKIADAFNDIVDANRAMAEELRRTVKAVGKEGQTRQRVNFGPRQGAWHEMEGLVNTLIDD